MENVRIQRVELFFLKNIAAMGNLLSKRRTAVRNILCKCYKKEIGCGGGGTFTLQKNKNDFGLERPRPDR